MAQVDRMVIKVISQKGTCDAGHKVGDEWVIEGEHAPAGICIYAFHAIFPFVTAMLFGASFPWETDPDVTHMACPDADNPVVFELRRVPK